MVKQKTITGQIYNTALELLMHNAEGLSWTDLANKIQKTHPTFHPKTINGCIWKLVQKYPNKVYKPKRGLFKLKYE